MTSTDPGNGEPGRPQRQSTPEPRPPGDQEDGDRRAGPRDRHSVQVGNRRISAGERLGAERDAVNGFRIHSQMFTGGQNVYLGQGPAAVCLYRLSEEELDEIRTAFVAPDGHRAVADEVRARPVTLLGGPAGAGKDALARSALLAAGHRAVFRLDSDTDPTALTAADLTTGAGYVLPDLPQHTADALTPFALRRLAAELNSGGRGCRLVVTVSPPVRPADPDVAAELVEVPSRPDATEVARVHLYWRAGIPHRARAERILARPDVRDLVRDRLVGVRTADAAELGRLLSEAAAAVPEEQVAERVRERTEAHAGQSFGLWLENLKDLARQCLAIGVAAFGGEAYVTVASLSRDLEERLQAPESPENPDRRRGTPLGGTRRARLTDIHATLVESEVETRHGGARGLVVRYTDPEMALRVLEHVWAEYDEIREELPGWLRQSAVSELPTVAVRAAVAAGVLARHAFDTVRTQILLPWAVSENDQLRDAAATTLWVVADDPAHAAAAYNLVRDWTEDDSPQLRATAARAWRVVFERDGTERAWALLHSLADSEELEVTEAVCLSLTDYMALGDGRHRHDALDLLDQWAVSGNYGSQRRFTGALAFLFAANDLLERVPGDDRRWWPSLLVAVARHPGLLPRVAALWEEAVNSPDLYEAAHGVLAGWARQVEADPAGRAALARLLTAVARRPRTELIVRHQAAAWVRSEGGLGAPRTGRAVLDHLDGRSTGQ
ncbi:hypothetical protein ACIPSA_11390 [Streptomyces sp. NPDC086549]|uniref:hypothetical protein n=1 Tax=Streptomyces sp. NPDC086549 TaxID=3365752 RepID=UPI003801BA85